MAGKRQTETQVLAETGRQLQNLLFQQNVTLSRNIPCDSVYKRFNLRLSGAVQTTYASGTPVADIDVFDNLIPNIQMVVGGQDTIKSVRPYIMKRMQMLARSIIGESKVSAGAAAATGNNPTVDGQAAVFGTTTQYTTVAQTVQIYFEDILANQQNSHKTYLNLKGKSSAELRLTCGAYSSIQNISDTTVITYANSTLVVDIFTVEAPFIDQSQAFAYLRETTKEVTFAAQSTDVVIDVNKGTKLRGLAFLVRNGDATKSLANNAVTGLKLQVNGNRIIKQTTFQAEQALNRARRGLQAPYASNASLIDGFAWIDLLQDGEFDSALDTSANNLVDSVQLLVSTAAAGSGATYSSYPVSVTIMTQEYVLPR